MITALILAAGKGTRMKNDLPKVLHCVAGRPLVAFPLYLAKALKAKTTLIVPKEHRELKEYLKKNTAFRGTEMVVQDPPLGTGHAVKIAMKKLENARGEILILYGDMPLLKETSVQALLERHRNHKASLSLVTLVSRQPSHFGRLVRTVEGNPVRIVEFKDATPEEQMISELNVGVYIADANFLRAAIKLLGSANSQKEFYLTDLVKIAHDRHQKIQVLPLADASEALGANTMEELAQIEKRLVQDHLKKIMNEGVRCLKPNTIVIDQDITVESGSTLMGPCYLLGKTTIGKNTQIEPGVFIRDSIIGDGVHIKASTYIEQAIIQNGARVGPFAHLRPEAEIGPMVKIGNFVEIKKSKILKGAKVNHLSYIGDTRIGESANIGAGTITCNYDGKHKHKTIIDEEVFIGSNVALVAPIHIGKKAVIGAGSTLTKNVKPYSLALTRASLQEIINWSKRSRS